MKFLVFFVCILVECQQTKNVFVRLVNAALSLSLELFYRAAVAFDIILVSQLSLLEFRVQQAQRALGPR